MIKEMFSMKSRYGLFSIDENVHGFAADCMDRSVMEPCKLQLISELLSWPSLYGED